MAKKSSAVPASQTDLCTQRSRKVHEAVPLSMAARCGKTVIQSKRFSRLLRPGANTGHARSRRVLRRRKYPSAVIPFSKVAPARRQVFELAGNSHRVYIHINHTAL